MSSNRFHAQGHDFMIIDALFIFMLEPIENRMQGLLAAPTMKENNGRFKKERGEERGKNKSKKRSDDKGKRKRAHPEGFPPSLPP